MHRKAFTLIELLVVIAIIAILAAILFPVFAQAKAAAKKTQALSNTKQTALGLILYSGDTDDILPYANPKMDPESRIWEPADDGSAGNWWSGGWAFKTQPYMKNKAIFVAPGDQALCPTLPGATVGRPSMGFAINAYVDGFWEGKYGAVATGGDWTFGGTGNQSGIGRPADTILLGSRHSADYGPKRQRKFGGIDEGHGMQGNAPFFGVAWSDTWLGPSQTPDGKAGTEATNDAQWPDGVNGTVTGAWQGNGVFAYVDGHAKSVKPIATCPDKWGQQDKNQWDASRS